MRSIARAAACYLGEVNKMHCGEKGWSEMYARYFAYRTAAKIAARHLGLI